jgi:hypothetical protein
MTQAKRVQEALAAGSPSLESACAQASLTLTRCKEWMEQGNVFEAAALNADAGNVIGLALNLSTSGTIPDHFSIPSPAVLDQLARLPVIAAEHRTEQARWVELNLANAPLLDRLAAIRSLRLLDPRNPAWKANHEELEYAAVKLSTAKAKQCIASGDAEAIVALASQVESMGLLSPAGQRLLHTLDEATSTYARQAAKIALVRVGDRLHVAWAAMNIEQAQRHLHTWHAIDAKEGGGHEDDVRGPTAWIESEQHRLQAARHVADLTADVVRSLDEVLPSQVIERRYAALLEVASSIPSAVESRVAHRIAQARRQRARRFVVTLFTIIAAAAMITTALIVRQRSLDRAATISHLSTCIEANLRENRLHDAIDCWNQAVLAELIDAPELAARSASIHRATEDLQRRSKRAAVRVATATVTLQSDDATLSDVEVALQLLRLSEPDVNAESQAAFDMAIFRAGTLRTLRIEEARNARMAEFERVEAAIPTERPAWHDLAAWKSRRMTISSVLAQLAEVRQHEAVAGTDLEWRADRIQGRLQKMIDDSSHRIERLEDAQRLAASLREIPVSEAAWHRTWENLLAHDAALLDELDPAAWTQAGEAARAARAIADWREHVLPILQQSGLIGGSVITTAGRAKTSLSSHLDMHAMYSPYRELAQQLASLATAVQSGSTYTQLRSDLDAAGLLDLQRSPIEGGYRYVRSYGSEWRAIDSRFDLSLAPAMLDPLSPMELSGLHAEPATVPLIAAMAQGLDDFEIHPGSGPAAIVDLLTPIEACDEEDDLLRLEVLRTIWKSLLNSGISMPQELRTKAADWLSMMSGSAPTAINADWPRLAKQSELAPQLATRRQARQASTGAPSSDLVEMVSLAAERRRSHVSNPRVIGGLLTPDPADPSGRLRVNLVASHADNAEVLVHDGRGWTFAPLPPIMKGELILPPKGVPIAPTIIFVTP